MKRILIKIQFVGTNYSGWQIQPNATTIQGEVTRAIRMVCGTDVELEGCSRTDAGVSALGLMAHFDVDTRINPDTIYKAINTHLPPDIRVLSSKEVAPDFHARYDVKSKTYEYHFYESPISLPYYDALSTRINSPFDYEIARQACKVFLGTHDFAGFCNAKNNTSTTVRTIFDIDLERSNTGYCLRVTGDGFLYNMVRILAGTIIEVGQGKIDIANLTDILNSLDRSRAGDTAPARGLVLSEVRY